MEPNSFSQSTEVNYSNTARHVSRLIIPWELVLGMPIVFLLFALFFLGGGVLFSFLFCLFVFCSAFVLFCFVFLVLFCFILFYFILWRRVLYFLFVSCCCFFFFLFLFFFGFFFFFCGRGPYWSRLYELNPCYTQGLNSRLTLNIYNAIMRQISGGNMEPKVILSASSFEPEFVFCWTIISGWRGSPWQSG